MVATYIALACVVAATGFSVIGVLGLFRLPDVFSMLHATGLVVTFGTALLLLSTIVLPGVSSAKAVLLALLLLVAAPVTTHAVASAAYRTGLRMRGRPGNVTRDDLEETAR